MFGTLFTTIEDAAPFVRQHTTGRMEALEEGAPIETGDLVIAVTGPGKIKATLATERLLQAHDLEVLLHTGTCTALTDEFDPGTLVGTSFVLEGDRVELDAPTYPRMPLECPFEVPAEGTLVSQDHTTDDQEQSYWERIADVRDETGYAVAYVAAQHGTPCHIVKAVGAGPEQDGRPSRSETADVIAAFLTRAVGERGGSDQ